MTGSEHIVKWRELANAWTRTCAELHDVGEAAEDDPGLVWMLANRGHTVGAAFIDALDALDVALDALESPRG